MNGEGIMALPQDMNTGAGMGAESAGGINDLTPFIQAQNALKEVGANKFSRELLSVGAELDPAEVSAFLDEIRAAGLTEEDKAALRDVVERVKADPNNYPKIRQELVNEGVPDDFLPEVFDPEFFVALEIAVEADTTMATRDVMADMPVQGFAQGGIVELPQMKAVAAELARMGQGGDTILAHITPGEAALLKRAGGSGTINPYTGLPQYIKKLWKKVTGAIKKVGKAIKKFAKSTVGRIVLTVALGAFLGPAAASFLNVTSVAGVAAVSAGIGSFSASIAAGDKFKDALRAGVTSAAVAGLGTAAYGGFTGTDVTSAGTYTGPTTLGETYDFYKGKVDNLLSTTPTGTEAAAAPAPGTAAAEVGTGTAGTAGTATEQLGAEGVSAVTPPATPTEAMIPPQGTPVAPPGAPVESTITPQGITSQVAPPTPAGTTAISSEYNPNLIDPGAPGYVSTPVSGTPATPLSDLQPQYGEPGFVSQYPTTQATGQAAGQAAGEPGLFSRTFSPSTRADIAMQETVTKANTLFPTDAAARELYIKANAPGVFTKYGPIMAAGLGATYLLGGMEGKPAEDPGLIDQGYTGEDYLRENADQFGQIAMPQTYSYQSLVPTPSDFGRVPVSSPGTIVPTGITALPTARALVQEYNRSGMYGVPEIYRAKKGSSPEGVTHFPRKTGPINGPGTGTSDSIPAMLSDGEFVFTAKAVRNMGGGSRRKGAARMYKMMKMLEGGPVGMASKKG
jgi:hypothetical protein